MGVADTLGAIARARGYVELEAEEHSRRLFSHEGSLVLFVIEDKLTLSVSKACATYDVARFVLALGASPTSAARATFVDLVGRPVEFFTFAELSFDIMTHELVPKFEIMSTGEVAALLAQYRIKHAQLPRMHTTDPCARYLGLTRGQVVRVLRSGSESAAYRMVT
jgi:DNA-directed RNA polymerase I, II, and III subunit RPABC1